MDQVSTWIPVYAGEDATAVVTAARFFSPAGPALRSAGHLRDRVPLQLGPFTVTLWLVDHVARRSAAIAATMAAIGIGQGADKPLPRPVNTCTRTGPGITVCTNA